MTPTNPHSAAPAPAGQASNETQGEVMHVKAGSEGVQESNPAPGNPVAPTIADPEDAETPEGSGSDAEGPESSENDAHASGREGKRLLAAHRAGSVLTRKQGILAKCADCMGEYLDGRNDCGIKACPLYRWMPYR